MTTGYNDAKVFCHHSTQATSMKCIKRTMQNNKQPVQSRRDEIIKDESKQMMKWVGHYSKLYFRKDSNLHSVFDTIEYMLIMEDLDALTIVEKLSSPTGKILVLNSISSETISVQTRFC